MRPSTLRVSVWRSPLLRELARDERDAAGLVDVGRDVAAARLEVATTGVRAAISSKSSISSGIPNSRAIARKWSTPFVDPPVAATEAIAFSIASRVTMSDGRDVVADELHHEATRLDRGGVLLPRRRQGCRSGRRG